jgi:hypothetical protein
MVQEYKAIMETRLFGVSRTVLNRNGAKELSTEMETMVLMGMIGFGPINHFGEIFVFLESLDFLQKETFRSGLPVPNRHRGSLRFLLCKDGLSKGLNKSRIGIYSCGVRGRGSGDRSRCSSRLGSKLFETTLFVTESGHFLETTALELSAVA